MAPVDLAGLDAGGDEQEDREVAEKGPAKQGRVLPVPDMEPKKRRGGKRARKYKERYGLTDTKKVRLHCCLHVHPACRASDAPSGAPAACLRVS